jgi:hypothetical protein
MPNLAGKSDPHLRAIVSLLELDIHICIESSKTIWSKLSAGVISALALNDLQKAAGLNCCIGLSDRERFPLSTGFSAIPLPDQISHLFWPWHPESGLSLKKWKCANAWG